MTKKSHVAMGYDVCPVCLKEHNETVVLDKRMRAVLPPKVATGWYLCPVHKEERDNGYIHVIECSRRATTMEDSLGIRTGKHASIKTSAWSTLLTSPVPEEGLAFMEVGVIDRLSKVVESRTEPDTPNQIEEVK